MNFNYEKIRQKMEHGGNQWTGYSDLFLVLSVVFLLLYVVANLRSGTMSIASRSAVTAAKMESDELKRQIKAYEVLKEDYLKKGASQDEVQLYQELMGKLNLLEDAAKEERNALYKKAQDLQEKEMALNRYQQIVKNVVNANLVSQSRLKKREDVIVDKEVEIEVKDQDIAQLDANIREREQELDRNNQTINQIESQLGSKIQALRQSYAHNKRSKAEMEQKIKELRDDSQQKISVLQDNNNRVAKELYSAQAQVEAKTRESQQLASELNRKQSEFKESITSMKAAHESSLAREKAEFDRALQNAQMTAQEKIARERAYRESLEKKTALYNQKLQGLNSELQNTQQSLQALEGSNKQLTGKLGQTQSELQQVKSKVGQYQGELQQVKAKVGEFQGALEQTKSRLGQTEGALAQTKGQLQEASGKIGQYQGALAQTKGKLAETEGALRTAQAKLDEQRKLAQVMQKEFAKHGVSADVDLKTGDVTIRFENEYFDTGSAALKSGMRQKVEKMIPVYAKSLFQDPNIVKRISSVEIVGFASPTYQGKYVNPESLSAGDRAAVNYNMDLSYQRAKGIFEHVFDTNKMQFAHQKQLLPLVKVSGRSYLAAEKGMERGLSSTSMESFCRMNDCRKSQKVIIKFNLKDE